MNKKLLLDCIQLCINSYQGKHGKIKKILDSVVSAKNKNVEYDYGLKGETLYIIFRGSDDPVDWAQNFDTHDIDVMGGKMHLGFYEDFVKTRKEINEAMKDHENIIITGHSKGACQALVQYFFSKLEYPEKKFTAVLVAPAKVMSKHFQIDKNEVTTIINGEDIVAKIPQWKYEHKGKVVNIGAKSWFWGLPVIRFIGVPFNAKPAKDHYPQEYLTNMKKKELL